MKAAADAGIIVHVTKSRLIMDGSISSRIMANVYGMAAEIEREFIELRTAEALRRRKASGLPMGRPKGTAKKLKLDSQDADLIKYYEKGLSFTAMAKLADCSRSTLYAWAARRHPDWVNDE
jgi:DNA invertase Pin-like site-specific DNA recombinase